MTERDTHFQISATFLYEKLARNAASSDHGLSDSEAFKQEQCTIIAQFLYDQACYVAIETNGMIGWPDPERLIDGIPDMIEAEGILAADPSDYPESE